MPLVKVIVNKLNKRQAPVSDFADKSNIVAVVSKGHTFSAEPEVHVLGIWYRDEDGFYYWGGGLSQVTVPVEEPEIPIDPAGLNWIHKDYGIDKIWQATKGENVKIAVIDTGLNFRNINIRNKKNISYYNIFNDSEKPEDSFDTEGHGSRCAGVIAAHGPAIFGVAPAADLLVIKATINGSMTCSNLAIAISKAVQAKADIISISYDLQDFEEGFSMLHDAALAAAKENILIVGSTGNGGSAKILADTYPASFVTAIGVGASDIDKNFWPKTTLNTNIDILAPGKDMELLGTGVEDTITDSGTSYATPYIAGVCALLLSVSKKKNLDLVRNIMKQRSSNKDKIQTQIRELYNKPGMDTFGLGIVTPLDIFRTIKP